MGSSRQAALFALLVASACGDDDGGARDDASPRRDAAREPDAGGQPDALAAACDPVSGNDLVLEPVAAGLDRPVFVGGAPGDRRLFIIEQAGRIRIVKDGELLAEPFLDLTGRVLAEGNEQGLLGLAFHPGWAENRRFFVFYTAAGGTPYLDRVAELAISAADPDRADPASEELVLEVDDPHPSHNGGMIAFGPDGYLYIGFGDGGGPGDPGNDGQDRTGLLGDLARIDVDGGAPYAIPPDNPFADGAGGARPEIWLSGLRNPWRWSFDRATGDLYIGDVGQATREEISFVPAGQSGLDLGWNDVEGDVCFADPDCQPSDHHAPVATYDHAADGCEAIIGGHVYRGACYPDLRGLYFYGDACSAAMYTLEMQDGVLVSGPTDITQDINPGPQSPTRTLVKITTFGEDATGEIYVADRIRGSVHHIAVQP